MKDVLIMVEERDGKPRRLCLSAFSFGKKMAALLGGEWYLLVMGHQVGEIAEEVSRYGAKEVFVVDCEVLRDYTAENYAPVVAEVAERINARILATVADTFGKDLLPRVAIRLEAGMASDVVAFQVQEGEIVYDRPVYAGNAIMTVKLTTPRHVVSIRGTDFEPAEPGEGQSPIQTLDLDVKPYRGARFVELKETVTGRPDLTEADVVVAGGRGLKSEEGFKLLESLADILGGAIGATRAAVDAGWAPNDLQIGQTGKIIAPQLYFAIGLSGAIQHVAGIRGAKTIVAINKDPEAPIFQVANYELVADLFSVVPQLVEEIRKTKHSGGSHETY